MFNKNKNTEYFLKETSTILLLYKAGQGIIATEETKKFFQDKGKTFLLYLNDNDEIPKDIINIETEFMLYTICLHDMTVKYKDLSSESEDRTKDLLGPPEILELIESDENASSFFGLKQFFITPQSYITKSIFSYLTDLSDHFLKVKLKELIATANNSKNLESISERSDFSTPQKTRTLANQKAGTKNHIQTDIEYYQRLETNIATPCIEYLSEHKKSKTATTKEKKSNYFLAIIVILCIIILTQTPIRITITLITAYITNISLKTMQNQIISNQPTPWSMYIKINSILNTIICLSFSTFIMNIIIIPMLYIKAIFVLSMILSTMLQIAHIYAQTPSMPTIRTIAEKKQNQYDALQNSKSYKKTDNTLNNNKNMHNSPQQ